MTRLPLLFPLLLIVSIIYAPHTVYANAQERPSENIALGRPYTLDPAPNYDYCTDPGDAKQITDGAYTQGHFWTQASTVGWKSAVPIITIDLGADKPICGASFNTAAGVAGVEWPLAIHVFVAGDDKQFHDVGDLVVLSLKHGAPPAQGYAVHRYWTADLRTHGRYVAFAFTASPYGFVDEIEVYAGAPDFMSETLEGPAFPNIRAHLADMRVAEAVNRRLRADIDAVRAKAAEANVSEEVKRAVTSELDAQLASFVDLPKAYGDDFKTILPLNALHARMFQTRAALWRGVGYAPITAWQSALWERLDILADPPRDASPRVQFQLMQNEYRAASLNLSNASDKDVTATLSIEGLPGGTNPPYIAVAEVAWTDTKSGRPVAAALPGAQRNADGRYLINIPSGFTRQVWFTAHPTDVPPGTHEGHIQVACDMQTLDVPISLDLSPIRFPDRPALHMGGWDYVNSGGQRGATQKNTEDLIAMLRAHFVDSPWATSAVMPFGKFDDQGNMVTPPDTAAFDEWAAKLWAGAPRYCVFLSVGNRLQSFDMGTPPFSAAVKAWAAFWAEHAKSLSIDPEQIFLLTVDEPYEPSQDAVIVAWAKAIRAANAGLKIWEDPTYDDMSKSDPELAAQTHVFCPNRQIFLNANQAYRDFFAEQRNKGTRIEFYSCSGPARLLDPYSYYRLQAWTAWQCGADAMYFWAFGDNGGVSSWQEYRLAGSDYAPVFLDKESVTASKELEACREGIEDFEYFVMLRDAIAAAEKTSVAKEILDSARALLTEGPAKVLNAAGAELMWAKPLDRTLADSVRTEVLKALNALAAAQAARS